LSADTPEAPRAFRLEAGSALKPADPSVAIIVEAGPAEEDAAPKPLPPKRKGRWFALLFGALGGLAGISLSLWAQDAVIAALRRSDVLGIAALGLIALALIAAIVLITRFIRDIRRQRRIERLRQDAAGALESRSAERARAVADWLVKLQASRPETAANRARFAAALPGLTDARDILVLAERELVAPLDKLAAEEIARAARQVSVVTAVSPRALIDLVFVVFAGGRLLASVTAIYGGRPGWLGSLRIAKESVGHLLVTGGLAAGDAVLQQIVGQGLAARLSAKLGEGVLNGLMTARFGLAALTVCRPLPFVEAKPPTLGDVASGLLSGARDEPAKP
jgi:putative membrane protein